MGKIPHSWDKRRVSVSPDLSVNSSKVSESCAPFVGAGTCSSFSACFSFGGSRSAVELLL